MTETAKVHDWVKPESINEWVNYIMSWRMRKGFVTSLENFTEKAMLVVTEVSEMVEAFRNCKCKSLDEPECRNPVGEEMADVVIRMFDLAGSLGFDMEAEIAKKMDKNEKRPYRHGKAF